MLIRWRVDAHNDAGVRDSDALVDALCDALVLAIDSHAVSALCKQMAHDSNALCWHFVMPTCADSLALVEALYEADVLTNLTRWLMHFVTLRCADSDATLVWKRSPH